VDRLHGLIQKVLETPGYREKALYFRKVITQTRGLDIAAEALERAFGEPQAADPGTKHAETLQV
jgi:zeaxanthin glucosyltransferase